MMIMDTPLQGMVGSIIKWALLEDTVHIRAGIIRTGKQDLGYIPAFFHIGISMNQKVMRKTIATLPRLPLF